VLGFDNWEVLTTNARPELTSIDANLQQLGRTAAQRVFAALDGVDVGSGTQYLPPRLIIRGSTIARR
jgi:LacI family transcriptional regulator